MVDFGADPEVIGIIFEGTPDDPVDEPPSYSTTCK